jgi:transposase
LANGITAGAGVTIGVDLGDEWSYYCMLSREGEVDHRGRVRTRTDAVGKQMRAWEPARVVMEVGTHSPWVSRVAEESGHEVIVANPRKVRLIAENDNKNDRLDPEILARLGRMDPRLLSPIQHRGASAQVDLTVLRSRDALVAARTQLVNHVRGMVKSHGGRLLKCSTESFPKKAKEKIPEALRENLQPILDTIADLGRRIREYDLKVARLGKEKYPETKVLQQVCGVGPLTALAYVLILENPHRFRKSRKVGAYLGLRSRTRSSGRQAPEMRITKAGDGFLRRLLVQSAQYILGPFGPDSDLKNHGLALASHGRKNAKKRAVIAVARKLAVLLHRLWITGEVYEPLRNTKRRNQELAE